MRFSLIVFITLAALFAPEFSARSHAESPEISVARKAFTIEEHANLTLLRPEGINGFEKGYEEAGETYVCDAGAEGEGARGVRYAYRLDQKKAAPLVATGWSRAESVGGNRDYNYSLYLDISYADGTNLWGQTYAFPVGDSDWTEGKVVIFPDKPIKWVSFYGMFRGHSGKASFKNLELYEYSTDVDATRFDGNLVELLEPRPNTPAVYLRDAGANGDYYAIKNASAQGTAISDLNLELAQETVPLAGSPSLSETVLRVKSASDADRALQLVYSLPFPSAPADASWIWYDGPRGERDVAGGELSKTRGFTEVGAGRGSMYPIGAVAAKTPDGQYAAAFGLAIDPNFPAFYRIACNGATKELYIVFDFALTKEKPGAEFRVLPLYWQIAADGLNVAPIEGDAPQASANIPFGSNPFRAAFDAYRQAFPDNFAVRAVKQGNWMAFADISKVPNDKDFGFQFKEGITELGEDDARGVTSFRYTEPMTWWQQVAKSETSPKSREAALNAATEIALENAKDANGNPKYAVAEARALLTTGFHDASGRPTGQMLDTPWCDGVVWSMNDAPGLVALVKEGKLRNPDLPGLEPIAGFDVKWNGKIADGLYGAPLDPKALPKTREEFANAQTQPGCDGEYVDSSEGYVTAMIDYKREHFAGMTTPLVYDLEKKRPGILRGLIAFEYVKKIAEDVHARGKLAMANSTPSLHFWLVPQLDVLGTETNWRWGGEWRPMPDEELMYRRVMCCGKPYCFLQNTDFTQFSHEACEKYMKRSLAYGMFPSMFSADASTKHYFENAELYERDRDLFKRYMPIVTAVAESGWEPETGAVGSDAKIYVERFGALPGAAAASNALRPTDDVYLTLFNDSEEEKEFDVTLSPAILKYIKESRGGVFELLEGKDVSVDGDKLRGKIGAQDVRVFRLR